MLVRFWHHLPPATALAMVDVVLQESKDVDDNVGAFRFAFSTLKGEVAFNSAYRLRLFQMLPILEVLDKDRAESLLQEDTETQAALTRFPQGMQSLDPGHHQDTPAGKRESSIYGVRSSNGAAPADPTESLNEQVENEIDRRVRLISLECSKDPTQALTDAMNLPQSNPIQSGFCSPRLVALMNVANATVEQEPTIARTALDESRKNLEGIQPSQQGRSLTEATQLYLKLGEIESAKKHCRN
jgi:hypothetical protein